MKDWYKRHGLHSALVIFIALAVVLFVIQPTVFAEENDPADTDQPAVTVALTNEEATNEEATNEETTNEAPEPEAAPEPTGDIQQPEAPNTGATPAANVETENEGTAAAPDTDPAGETADPTDDDSSEGDGPEDNAPEGDDAEDNASEGDDEGDDAKEGNEDEDDPADKADTDPADSSAPQWSDPNLDTEKDLYKADAGLVWVQFSNPPTFYPNKELDSEEQYKFNGSYALPIYKVDENNPTLVRVSAEGQPELWIDLKEAYANVQGEYIVTKPDTDPYAQGTYKASDIYIYDDNGDPITFSGEVEVTGTGVNGMFPVEYTDNDISKTGWISWDTMLYEDFIATGDVKNTVYVYDEDGYNVDVTLDKANVTVIGWDNNKWDAGPFFHVIYEINGEEKTGWVRKSNVELISVATKDLEPKPEPPSGLADDQVVYLGNIGDYSAIFAYLNNNYTMPVQLYELEDKYGNTFYAYCADHNVLANSGYTYTKIDITKLANQETLKDNEDILRIFGYNDLSEMNNEAQKKALDDVRDTLGKINAIVKNGYQQGGGNLNDIKAAMQAKGYENDNLTEGIALTATQTAIWYTVHGEALIPIDKYEDDIGMYKILGYCYGSKAIDNLTDDEKNALIATFKYLTGLEPDYEPGEPVVSDPKEIELAIDVTILPASEDQQEEALQASYNRDVLFTMSVVSEELPNGLQEELTVTINVGGETVKTEKLSGLKKTEDGYIISGIELRDGQKVNITIKGNLTNEGYQGVYIFTAKDGTNASQTFVGTAGVGPDGQPISGFQAFGKAETTFKITTENTPGGGGGGEDPEDPDDPEDPKTPDPKDPEDPKDPDEPKTPEEPKKPQLPEYPTELPDPNDPDSPDEITIWEDGVPKTYIKVWDPEEEEYVWILDDDIPLSTVPATGDNSLMWLYLIGASSAGLAALSMLKKRSEE